MDLQGELIEVLQRNPLERIDQIPLDDQLFHLGRFFLPVRLFEREKAVADEPPERSRAIVHGPAAAWSCLSGTSGYFAFQFFSRFRCLHLRLEPENHRNYIALLLIRGRVKNGLAKIDRKNTRLNSSHGSISYAVFC